MLTNQPNDGGGCCLLFSIYQYEYKTPTSSREFSDARRMDLAAFYESKKTGTFLNYKSLLECVTALTDYASVEEYVAYIKKPGNLCCAIELEAYARMKKLHITTYWL